MKIKIEELETANSKLPHCNTLEDVRKFYLNLERICRQLAGLGNDTDSDLYYNLLETKLTRPMLREILAVKKEAGDSWTTSKFRLELKRLLESEIEISSILKKMGDEKKGEEKKQFSKPKDEPHTPKRTGNVKRMSPRDEDESPLPTVACPTVGKTERKETVREKKGKRSLYCYFCQKNHWSNECRNYSIGETAPETQAIGFKYCLLKCVQAKMFNPKFGRKKNASGTIFIDSGSQSSMISERLANELMLQPHSFEKLELRGVGPRDLATSSYSKMVKVGLETSIKEIV
uniref:Uncharacterized protein n=1 Tax=Meloidogyne enterolobii TaxID=390850 RepID=A0A6V7XMC9_MELEN|nr:unnamed protein product [Meloidogyne enterolobii]CAD2200047.1 unnamed protein product [Meloidogyne enterolobii]